MVGPRACRRPWARRRKSLRWPIPAPPAPSAQGGIRSGQVVSETVDLVHAFVEDRRDADISTRKSSPIHDVFFVAKVVPVYAELRRDGSGCRFAGLDAGEGGKHAGDVAVGLFCPPAVPRVAVD